MNKVGPSDPFSTEKGEIDKLAKCAGPDITHGTKGKKWGAKLVKYGSNFLNILKAKVNCVGYSLSHGVACFSNPEVCKRLAKNLQGKVDDVAFEKAKAVEDKVGKSAGAAKLTHMLEVNERANATQLAIGLKKESNGKLNRNDEIQTVQLNEGIIVNKNILSSDNVLKKPVENQVKEQLKSQLERDGFEVVDIKINMSDRNKVTAELTVKNPKIAEEKAQAAAKVKAIEADKAIVRTEVDRIKKEHKKNIGNKENEQTKEFGYVLMCDESHREAVLKGLGEGDDSLSPKSKEGDSKIWIENSNFKELKPLQETRDKKVEQLNNQVKDFVSEWNAGKKATALLGNAKGIMNLISQARKEGKEGLKLSDVSENFAKGPNESASAAAKENKITDRESLVGRLNYFFTVNMSDSIEKKQILNDLEWFKGTGS